MTDEKMAQIADLLRQSNQMLEDHPPPDPLEEDKWDAICEQIKMTSTHLAYIYSRTGRVPTVAEYFAEFGDPESSN